MSKRIHCDAPNCNNQHDPEDPRKKNIHVTFDGGARRFGDPEEVDLCSNTCAVAYFRNAGAYESSQRERLGLKNG